MAKIAIVGAGVGGLTLARALAGSAHEVVLFERAPELRAAGAGILIQINAMQALDHIGAGDGVRARGAAVGVVALRDKRGRMIQEVDLSRFEDQFGTLGYALHRSDLVHALSDDVTLETRFDKGLDSVELEERGCVLRFEDGSSEHADLLVGADGIHSATRRALFGDEPLRYSGYTAWRGIAPLGDVQEGMGEFWGGALRYGCLPIGGGKINWFAVSMEPAGGEDGEDVSAELVSLFEGWCDPVLRVLARTRPEDVLRTDVFDRPPASVWGEGPVTLLGDAAHPMTPNLGQGGGQAVEDAVVLAHVLREHGATTSALRAYERARMERANMFVTRSFTYGQVAHWTGGVSQFARDLAMRSMPRALMRRQFEGLYRFELP